MTRENRDKNSAFRQLSHSDLTTFDQEARELILKAMELGCLGRISSKGHCILRNSANGTTSVPPKMHTLGRTAQNTRAQMRRFIAEHHVEGRPTTTTQRQHGLQRMTVAEAFVKHGAAFARWFGELPRGSSGLAAETTIEVAFDNGTPRFTVIEHTGVQQEPTNEPGEDPPEAP
ncbi:hypothetical protein [Streptomyces sp. NRRL F-5053]|uniref:hypothetical protein n=1 Tax=Streptomyces sp. NRRL F-5053 TaxID=1463854 RepID=UPI0013319729|nr:hypothetical protein [Streptomyces sp. NRRL F-5053]